MLETYQIPAQFPVQMFRAYDIRGEVSELGINENVAYVLGKALGTTVLQNQHHEIIVACDARLTGVALKNALIAGILSTGCNAIDIGIGPSPMLYFSTFYLSTHYENWFPLSPASSSSASSPIISAKKSTFWGSPNAEPSDLHKTPRNR